MDDQDNSQIPQAMDAQAPSMGSMTDPAASDDGNSPVSDVKQQALEALLPLVDSIEGTPEAKFEILMGALQSSPSVELLQKALTVAKEITDPAMKAEALVDVLTEANEQENTL